MRNMAPPVVNGFADRPFTITLYRSKAIIVMVQIEAQPKTEPNIAYNSHMNAVQATKKLEEENRKLYFRNLLIWGLKRTRKKNWLTSEHPCFVVAVNDHWRSHREHHQEVNKGQIDHEEIGWGTVAQQKFIFWSVIVDPRTIIFGVLK